MPRYNPAVVEPQWQKYWEEHQTFAAPRLPAPQKMYVLDMFPYPSGEGLHVGHPEGYTATDIVCRFQRMRGMSVLHPMGWDAFGLPAEQHAKKTGTHPRTTTENNIATFRRQLKMLGFSYDWSRELATTDPDYFRWTQFIFLVLYDTWFDAKQQKGCPIAELPIPPETAAEGPEAVRRFQDDHRLAYQLDAPVNWCPALGTVLANEEVVGGVSERGGHPVVRVPMRQWMLRITAYADRLEKDLDLVDWPESIKLLQRNWIGRSTGAEVDFFVGRQAMADGMPSQEEFEYFIVGRIDNGYPRRADDDVLRIYTTRADTLFGATYMVIAPEHPLVERLTLPGQAQAVRDYRDRAARKSDLDRTDLAKEKTGVFTGSYAVNPVNGKAVPIWVADYVLISYGTGAIMAVPAHDTRDFDFAVAYGLPIIPVVDPGTPHAPREVGRHAERDEYSSGDSARDDLLAGRVAFTADGVAINSGRFTGMSTPQFKQAIADDLANKGLGRAAVNYKLRDWLFSRQHFWGEPFPLLHELDGEGRRTGVVRPLRPEDLPVDLPERMTFDAQHDSLEPPLEKAPADWLYVVRDGKRYQRETNTMPQWAGSCWYYLRFLDPKNARALVDPAIERAWMPVDLYVGGAEHAVLHLLYARFWHKVIYDCGYVSQPEPFRKLVNQGMILGEMEFTAYRRSSGEWAGSTEVQQADGGRYELKDGRQPVEAVKLPAEQVEKQGESFVLKADPTIRIEARAYKMSKSRGNVVNPDQVVRDFGADSLRLYEMFMGPLEAVKPWSMDGVSGVRGFLDRVWRMTVDERADEMQLHGSVADVPLSPEQNRVLHKTIKAVTQDCQTLSFNTAIARMMECTNYFFKADPRPRAAIETLVLLLSPFAPHLAEELWRLLGHPATLAYEAWPPYDETLLREETIEVPIQINGKLRSRIEVPAGSDRVTIEASARANPRVIEMLEGKSIQKVIVVPGRMVNFVVKDKG
jgi:leucyl-tRNA synthetase